MAVHKNKKKKLRLVHSLKLAGETRKLSASTCLDSMRRAKRILGGITKDKEFRAYIKTQEKQSDKAAKRALLAVVNDSNRLLQMSKGAKLLNVLERAQHFHSTARTLSDSQSFFIQFEDDVAPKMVDAAVDARVCAEVTAEKPGDLAGHGRGARKGEGREPDASISRRRLRAGVFFAESGEYFGRIRRNAESANYSPFGSSPQGKFAFAEFGESPKVPNKRIGGLPIPGSVPICPRPRNLYSRIQRESAGVRGIEAGPPLPMPTGGKAGRRATQPVPPVQPPSQRGRPASDDVQATSKRTTRGRAAPLWQAAPPLQASQTVPPKVALAGSVTPDDLAVDPRAARPHAVELPAQSGARGHLASPPAVPVSKRKRPRAPQGIMPDAAPAVPRHCVQTGVEMRTSSKVLDAHLVSTAARSVSPKRKSSSWERKKPLPPEHRNHGLNQWTAGKIKAHQASLGFHDENLHHNDMYLQPIHVVATNLKILRRALWTQSARALSVTTKAKGDGQSRKYPLNFTMTMEGVDSNAARALMPLLGLTHGPVEVADSPPTQKAGASTYTWSAADSRQARIAMNLEKGGGDSSAKCISCSKVWSAGKELAVVLPPVSFHHNR